MSTAWVLQSLMRINMKKTVERSIQDPQTKVRCLSALFEYALPSMLNDEPMIEAMTATYSLPNTCPGPSRVQYELVTGEKPAMDQHASEQVGIRESRRANSTEAERRVYMRSTSDLAGHNRVCIFMRGLMRLRKS